MRNFRSLNPNFRLIIIVLIILFVSQMAANPSIEGLVNLSVPLVGTAVFGFGTLAAMQFAVVRPE